MLTDDDLRALIESAAGDAPAPGPLTTEQFATEAKPRAAKKRNLAVPIAAVAASFVAVMGVLAFWTQSGGSSQAKFATVGGSIGGGVANGAAAPADEGAPQLQTTGSGGGATGGAAGTAAATQPAAIADSAKVIKNGSLEIGVAKGGVTESVNRLTGLATGLGGYVSDTKTTASSQSGAQASATIALRVPAASFEQLITEASKLGEVHSTTTSGQDVTAQFTDIDAQLNALGATRDQLLLVLGEAKNVNDILAVQDRLTGIQTQIDQLEGQQRLLTDQTSYGTLSVTLLEPGATIAVAPVNDDKDLGDAWSKARENFGDAIESIVEASGTLAVITLSALVILGGGWLVYRAARRRIITL